jgi:hypothetical protein
MKSGFEIMTVGYADKCSKLQLVKVITLHILPEPTVWKTSNLSETSQR